MEPEHARLELARRYLHIFGPATAVSFARWAGIAGPAATTSFKELSGALPAVWTPVGNSWILAKDETAFRSEPGHVAPARLLPSGDAFYLAWGADRETLVHEAKRRAELWTSRVWPGALLVNGEIAGVWSRSASEVRITAWRSLSLREREAVEIEAMSLPLPGLARRIRWSTHAGTEVL